MLLALSLLLLGRGGATNNHIGNKRFRSIVADHQREYLGARKKEKAVIARKIVSIIQENGGRFLKRSFESDVWVEVNDKKATEKTSQALREGLDVRHKTIRPEKMTKRNFGIHDKNNSNNNKTTSTQANFVRGHVIADGSPSLASQATVPELNEESLFAMYLPPPLISRSDFDNAEQV